MINEINVKQYCKDDISLIENYDKAVKDSEMWDCHHRAEILPCGVYSQSDLKNFDLYWNRPANELIFLTKSDHTRLHKTWKNNSMFGKSHTEQTKKKMSEVKIGEKNPFYGKTHSEEVKRKISEAKGKSVSQYTKSGEFIKTFNSTREAERQTGISHGSISACCLGKLNFSGGFMWRYA